MIIKKWIIALISVFLAACNAAGAGNYQTIIDKDTAEKVDQIIRSDVIPLAGERHGEIISRVSSNFLGVPYRADTLIGGSGVPEALVANFNGLDCFTLVDYVEALSRSRDQKDFMHSLAKVRYTGNKVDYLSRRHFFSDWFANAPYNAKDITPLVSADYKVIEKQLNRKPDGGQYITGLGFHTRKIQFIPGSAINEKILDRLKNGDYVGIYSPLEGLDVSHVGIVIRHDGQVWFRNASSLAVNRKVVDVPFLKYVRPKPGIVVLRSELPSTEAAL
ncbi:DUF1460 domain-containing protein [Pseudomonas sp. AMR01]|uniref:DUF1460 domain-containing protein n=1 Tax=Pseudomonas sp. AMR01 TaxID=3064904 RepID=UPI0035C1CFA9